MLRKGQARQVIIPKGDPSPTARKAKCRWTAGRDYTVTAPATYDADGQLDQKPEEVRCLVLAITDDEVSWTLALTVKAAAERPVFLARNPGAQRNDYAFDPARALPDEPEVIREDAADIITRMAKEELATRRPDRRPWAA